MPWFCLLCGVLADELDLSIGHRDVFDRQCGYAFEQHLGVIRPVRPILNVTLRTSLMACAWRYFQAAAQFGGLACQRFAAGRWLWRKTTPSVAKGRGLLCQCWRQCCACSSCSTGWL